MADIRKQCFIKGGAPHSDQPFSWHVWEITIPESVIGTGAVVHDICIPQKFPPETKCIEFGLSTLSAVTTAGTAVIDIEVALIAAGSEISDANLSGKFDLSTGHDLEALTSTSVHDGQFGPAFFSYQINPAFRRVFNLELTTTADISDDAQILFYALLGRLNY